MPIVRFTPNLARHVACPSREVVGSTVRSALEVVFQENAALRGYVLDDQGSLRRHMAVFVDGVPLKDRAGLADPVAPAAQIYVMQALSGG